MTWTETEAADLLLRRGWRYEEGARSVFEPHLMAEWTNPRGCRVRTAGGAAVIVEELLSNEAWRRGMEGSLLPVLQAEVAVRSEKPLEEEQPTTRELIARALDESKLGGDLARAQVLATLALAQAMVEEQPELEELGYADGVFGVAWQAEQRR